MADYDHKAGDKVGPYKLISPLGFGAFAEVWVGWNRSLREHHAVKILRWIKRRNPDLRSRFFTEIAVARELSRTTTDPRSKFIVHIEGGSDPEVSPEAGEDDWFAMRLETGGNLAEFFHRNLVSMHMALTICRDIALALQLAHNRTIAGVKSGLFHRDLKPANILLSKDLTVVVSDWGLVRAEHLGNEDGGGSVVNGTAIGTGMGTPGVSAPEQLAGDSTDGAAADVFSLGVIIAFAVAGFNPGEKGDRKLHYQAVQDEDLADVPQALRELIEETVRVNPSERPSVDDVIVRLEAAMERYPAEVPAFRPRLGIAAQPVEPMLTPPKTPAPEGEPVPSPTPTPLPDVMTIPEHESFPGTTLGDPPHYGWWAAGVVAIIAIIAVAAAMFWPKGQPDAPEPVKEVAMVETPIADPPKPEPLVEVTPKEEPKLEPPIVTPTPVVEVAPVVKVEVKPKVEQKPVVKPQVEKPKPEEPKPEVAKVTTASATITTHPETAKVNDRIEIVAKVAIPDGATVKSVKLYYKSENDNAFKNIPMELNGTTANAKLTISPGFGATVTYKVDVRLEGDTSPHWSAVVTTTIVQ